ncbi:DNA-binding protein [Ralstonia solanacearum]|uniref:DNA-binding protein n=1 Tax=Ralstonia solanacearum TaxID=305 RepID=UPI00078DFD5B|nr:DNA-binding protein [Ralstonia solanacearum]AMP40292.1 DNA-binding protein [Ralstonia solanacearum]AXV89150.1 DNA-binding protein [Ralstonia solanacearum]AXW08961.1 DNA-binding protein [Ralstonia solanacearum]AXW26753.1 DNA-binding protein [Ralstonia solanacearum]AXW83663.1 DNA-binding protein [Ralstonia solanacearum]
MRRGRTQHLAHQFGRPVGAGLRAVVRALGYGRARDWLVHHGGVNVSISQYRTRALGLEANELARLRTMLALHLDSDGRCWLPKADKLFIRVRDAQIRKDRHSSSINALVRHHHLSSRQIVNICREDDDRQLGLF